MITPNSHMNPVYSREEKDSVIHYINSGGWVMEHTKTREMERMICDYTGAKHAHMVPSATMGLLLASMLSDIKPKELFDCSAYTQAATANGAILMGAYPEFVDVDPISYTIDFEKVKNRVVYITSINGRTPDNYRESITQLQAAGHFVIEDAAQALGSWHGDFHVGTMGDVGVFSFGAPKIITTGQGGCIITNRDELSERIHAIKNFGRTVGVGEVYNVMGMNFKFTDLQASFGVEQMRKLPEIVKRKKEIYNTYKDILSGLVDFVHTDLNYVTPTYPEILVNNRDELVNRLRLNQVGCRAVYSSLSQQPFHSQWAKPTPVTDFIARHGVHLPSQFDLTTEDVAAICKIIKECV
jgi:perosamine synthetase